MAIKPHSSKNNQHMTMEMQTISWKTVPQFPLYEVSQYGHVRFKETGDILTPFKKKTCNDYLSVNLYYRESDGARKRKMMLVHRIVAMAWIENPHPSKWKEINHKDEDKTNNAASNLEWCDHKYNCNYGTQRKEKMKKWYEETREIRAQQMRDAWQKKRDAGLPWRHNK